MRCAPAVNSANDFYDMYGCLATAVFYLSRNSLINTNVTKMIELLKYAMIHHKIFCISIMAPARVFLILKRVLNDKN